MHLKGTRWYLTRSRVPALSLVAVPRLGKPARFNPCPASPKSSAPLKRLGFFGAMSVACAEDPGSSFWRAGFAQGVPAVFRAPQAPESCGSGP